MLRPLRLQHLQYLQLPSMSPRWLTLPGCLAMAALAMAADMVSIPPLHFTIPLHTTLLLPPRLPFPIVSPLKTFPMHIRLTEHLTVLNINLCHHPLAALHRPPQGIRRLHRRRLTRGRKSHLCRPAPQRQWICPTETHTDRHQVKRCHVKTFGTAFHES
jgi:hypothetical protein